MKLTEIPENETFASSFLFISPQGVGKTVAACSFPKPRLYDFEGKLDSVKHWYNLPEFKDKASDIDVVQVSDIYKFYNDTAPYLLENGPGDRQTIILDSITNMSRDIINPILRARKSMPKGGDRAKQIPGGVILPSWDEFDAEDVILGGILSDLFNMSKRHKVNVVCIAHPVKVSGPNGVSQTSRIVAKGFKAPQTVMNYFQEIYHMEREFGMNFGDKPKRVVLTQGGEFSRTAWPFLPDRIDFTDRLFYDVLKELLEANRDKMEVTEKINLSTSLPQSF